MRLDGAIASSEAIGRCISRRRPYSTVAATTSASASRQATSASRSRAQGLVTITTAQPHSSGTLCTVRNPSIACTPARFTKSEAVTSTCAPRLSGASGIVSPSTLVSAGAGAGAGAPVQPPGQPPPARHPARQQASPPAPSRQRPGQQGRPPPQAPRPGQPSRSHPASPRTPRASSDRSAHPARRAPGRPRCPPAGPAGIAPAGTAPAGTAPAGAAVPWGGLDCAQPAWAASRSQNDSRRIRRIMPAVRP